MHLKHIEMSGLIPNHVRREIYRNRYKLYTTLFGDVASTRALYGRYLAYTKEVPEDPIALIAYYRENKVPGFMNRSQRKHV